MSLAEDEDDAVLKKQNRVVSIAISVYSEVAISSVF